MKRDLESLLGLSHHSFRMFKMFPTLLSAILISLPSIASTSVSPIVVLDGGNHKVVEFVGEDELLLDNGEVITISEAQDSFNFAESETRSEITAAITTAQIHITIALGRIVENQFNFSFILSELVDGFGVLSVERDDETRKNHFFKLSKEGRTVNLINISIDTGSPLITSSLKKDNFYECRLFHKGEEIACNASSNLIVNRDLILAPEIEGKGVSNPKPVIEIVPSYPTKLIKGKIAGFALVEFIIDDMGRVRDTKVLETNHKLFGRYGEIAFKNTRYYPARSNGKPVSVRVRQSLSFEL